MTECEGGEREGDRGRLTEREDDRVTDRVTEREGDRVTDRVTERE